MQPSPVHFPYFLAILKPELDGLGSLLPYRRPEDVNDAAFRSFHIHHRLRERNEALWAALKERRAPFNDVALPALSAADLDALKPIFFCACTFCRAARRLNGVPTPYLPGLAGVVAALPEDAAPGAAEDLALAYALRIDRSPDVLAVVAGHFVSELMRQVPKQFPILSELFAPRNARQRRLTEEMHAVAAASICAILNDPSASEAAAQWNVDDACRNRLPGADGKRFLNWMLTRWLGLDATGQIKVHAFVESPCGQALLDAGLIRVDSRPSALFYRSRPLTLDRLEEAVGPRGSGATSVPPRNDRPPDGGIPAAGHVFKLIDYVVPAHHHSQAVSTIGLIPRESGDTKERATYFVIDDELDADNRLDRLPGFRRSPRASWIYVAAARPAARVRETHEPRPHEATDLLDAVLGLQPRCDRENAVITGFAARFMRLARDPQRHLQAAFRDAIRATDTEVAGPLGLGGRTDGLVRTYPTPIELTYFALRQGVRCRFARTPSPYPTSHPLRPHFRRITALTPQAKPLGPHAAAARMGLGPNFSRHFNARLKKLRPLWSDRGLEM